MDKYQSLVQQLAQLMADRDILPNIDHNLAERAMTLVNELSEGNNNVSLQRKVSRNQLQQDCNPSKQSYLQTLAQKQNNFADSGDYSKSIKMSNKRPCNIFGQNSSKHNVKKIKSQTKIKYHTQKPIPKNFTHHTVVDSNQHKYTETKFLQNKNSKKSLSSKSSVNEKNINTPHFTGKRNHTNARKSKNIKTQSDICKAFKPITIPSTTLQTECCQQPSTQECEFMSFITEKQKQVSSERMDLQFRINELRSLIESQRSKIQMIQEEGTRNSQQINCIQGNSQHFKHTGHKNKKKNQVLKQQIKQTQQTTQATISQYNEVSASVKQQKELISMYRKVISELKIQLQIELKTKKQYSQKVQLSKKYAQAAHQKYELVHMSSDEVIGQLQNSLESWKISTKSQLTFHY